MSDHSDERDYDDDRVDGQGRDGDLSSAEQLQRLRDGLARGVRRGGGRPARGAGVRASGPEAETPAPGRIDRSREGASNPIDRAIGRVGSVFDDGPGGVDGARDPYAAAFETEDDADAWEAPAPEERLRSRRPQDAAGRRPARGVNADSYDPPEAEPGPRGARRSARRGPNRAGEDADDLPGEPPSARAQRRARLAARAGKGAYGFQEDAGGAPSRLGRSPRRREPEPPAPSVDPFDPIDMDPPAYPASGGPDPSPRGAPSRSPRGPQDAMEDTPRRARARRIDGLAGNVDDGFSRESGRHLDRDFDQGLDDDFGREPAHDARGDWGGDRDPSREEPARGGRVDDSVFEPDGFLGRADRDAPSAPRLQPGARAIPEDSDAPPPAPRFARRRDAARARPTAREAAMAEAKAPRAQRALAQSRPRRRGAAPFGAVERLLAGRYLRARRKEGFISVIALLSLIGITLAVAVLIVVMSVMNGFRAELVDKIVGVNGHMIATPIDRSLEDFDGVARSIRTVPGVTRAAPLIEGQAFATSPRGGVGVMVRGLSQPDLLTLERVSVTPEQAFGSLSAFGEGDGVAIGAGLARRLGVTVGDKISLISPQGAVTPFGVAPKRKAFDILYVFKMGMSNYDDVLVFMPIEKSQAFFNRPGRADYIEIKVATPDRLDGYREDIDEAAGRPLVITTWQETNGVFIGALETEQSVMFLILSMLILIASLIVISGLIMLVKEKGPDIAILRTMGLSRLGVMRVFFMCGAAIGVIGTVVGVSLGVLVALNVDAIKVFVEDLTGAKLFPSEVYLFSALPSRLEWSDVGFTVAITLGLSFVATLYPAWRAARMDPVDALRYE